MKITIVFLALSFFVSFGVAGTTIECAQFYAQGTSSKEAEVLSRYLNGPKGTSENPTVKAVGNRVFKIIFIKNKDGVWVSKHNAVTNTLTAEGDIRLPIFLMGTKLAAQLGYVIREIGNNEIEIEVPDAELLAFNVDKINKSLKARGLEPITYLPVRAGFVTVKETISMILSAQGDYLVHFPYADKDLVLAPHEVSFHMGAMLLSKKIISRARIITEENQKLVDLIDTYKDQLGPIAKRLKGQVRIERNFEMDAGLASMVTSPGFTRRDGGMKSYAELNSQISDRYWKYMVRNIEFLNRPRMQPYEAVLMNLEMITGVDLSDLTKADRKQFYTMTIPIARVGEKVALDAAGQALVKKIAVEYAQLQRPKFETGEPEVWLKEFLQNLDQRIQDISDSLPQ
jgi:hypothetical protein